MLDLVSRCLVKGHRISLDVYTCKYKHGYIKMEMGIFGSTIDILTGYSLLLYDSPSELYYTICIPLGLPYLLDVPFGHKSLSFFVVVFFCFVYIHSKTKKVLPSIYL